MDTRKKYFFTIILLFSCIFRTEAQQANPALFLADQKQSSTLGTIRKADANLYTMTCLYDYKLDQILREGVSGTDDVLAFVAKSLLNVPAELQGKMKAACSAFICRNPEGDVLYCRNFDYGFKKPVEMMLAIPAEVSGGNASLSMVALGFVDYHAGQLSDGKTDLSKLMAAPYAQMDGMNDKGLAISVLQLPGIGAEQHDPGKGNTATSVVMREILDRAADVDEAVEIFKSHNFFAHGSAEKSSYHFFLADRSGRSVVVEYIQEGCDGPDGAVAGRDFTMRVARYNTVTNFFMSLDWYGKGDGMDRWQRLNDGLVRTGSVLTEDQAMALLKKVAQGNTHWSVIYNLDKGTAMLRWEKSPQTLRFSLQDIK